MSLSPHCCSRALRSWDARLGILRKTSPQLLRSVNVEEVDEGARGCGTLGRFDIELFRQTNTSINQTVPASGLRRKIGNDGELSKFP